MPQLYMYYMALKIYLSSLHFVILVAELEI